MPLFINKQMQGGKGREMCVDWALHIYCRARKQNQMYGVMKESKYF